MHLSTTNDAEDFAATLIRWQKRHGRVDLPWQSTRDPYRIWLSEIMLQQTQVATVIPYYQRFLDCFPDIQSLAAAPSSEVLALWSGLGYYARARNLHRCSQQIVSDFGGHFPTDPIVIASLPGIGRSTAAAIAVFSYGTRAAILDGNVKRVLARVFGISGYPGSQAVEVPLWQCAESLLPDTEQEAYTQGLMDLGAMVCARSKPACHACPLAHRCIAKLSDRIAELPTRKPRSPLPIKRVAMLVVTHDDAVLLERRPDTGIWGGLLSLPEVEWPVDAKDSAIRQIRLSAMRFGNISANESPSPLPPFTHGFTHYKLHIFPFAITLSQRAQIVAQGGIVWHKLDQLAQAGLPAPVRKLLEGASLNSKL